ncbi:hypothetical protein ABZ401_23180 [Streptomyces sp. NPDC005892]|uniref:hypothetical protein n=1 Tax=Streptomyces sp. NPDC005892 TaxID=3155593 RepID=UPI0033CE6A0E
MPTPAEIWADAGLPTRRLAGLALNPAVPESVLLRLLADAPLAARMVLCRDRVLPYTVVDAVIEHPDTRFNLLIPGPTPQEPETVRRNALSHHPVLRRRAAGDHLLPPDLVARLADDNDLGVRVLLAQNHPDAPAPLLLRGFVEYTGAGRSRLTGRPNFPTDGLAAYADHEDPEVRALATLDPGTGSAVVERLSRDPDPTVRAAAARHPALPPSRLAELLDDEELAHAAAANPALDPDTVRLLVEMNGREARPAAREDPADRP